MFPEIIHTERLTLRRLSLEDAKPIFAAYAQDAEVTRYLTFRPNASLEETTEYIKTRVKCWEQGEEFLWTIRCEPAGLIGSIALRVQTAKAEIGYVIARSQWGQGYATEALRAMIALALNEPKIYRVWAYCDAENPASARVLEKAGMQREGLLRRWAIHPNISEVPRDCLCYATIKA